MESTLQLIRKLGQWNYDCFNFGLASCLYFSREQEATRLKKAKRRKWKRYALIGVTATAGGALVTLTGVFSAPVVASAAGSC